MSTASFPVTVLSAEGSLFSGNAVSLTAPTSEGEITILPHHEPLAATLNPGEVVIRHAGSTDEIVVGGGIVEVSTHGTCRILADLAIRSADIDEKAAEEARKRAEKNLGEAHDEREVAAAQAALMHALMQLKIAEKRRKH